MLNSIYTTKEALDKKKKLNSVLPRPALNTEPDFIKPEFTSSLYTTDNSIANQIKKDSAITGGSSLADFDKENELEDNLDPKTKKPSSFDYGGAATGALSLASSVVSREQSEPQGRKESTASALSLGAQGAALGATVGGPWGAAVGFVAGTGYGLIKGGSDAKKRVKKAREEQANFLSKTIKEREAAQRLSDDKNEVEKSKNVLQNQMGLIGSKYTNN